MLITASIKKVAEAEAQEQRIIWAEVYIPDVLDTDGEFMSAEDIRDMAYDFMRSSKLRKIDVGHNNVAVKGACVVESFIARKGDPLFLEGAWVVGMHIPCDDTWDKIKKGEINGFSMEAMVTKRKAKVAMEVPAVIKGKTSKDDDHEHDFQAMFDPAGNLVGGRTDPAADGHWHMIKRGTVTEYHGPESRQHRHRFAFIDGMRTPQ
jgi:hypothetical protein